MQMSAKERVFARRLLKEMRRMADVSSMENDLDGYNGKLDEAIMGVCRKFIDIIASKWGLKLDIEPPVAEQVRAIYKHKVRRGSRHG